MPRVEQLVPDPQLAVETIGRVGAVPKILEVVAEATGLRFTLIGHVTASSWTACAVRDRMAFGLEVGGKLDIMTTLCREARAALAPIVISHASEDPLYRDHPTPKLYGFESYIAVPIVTPTGAYFGNLCGLDSRPVDLSPSRVLAMMTLFADLIGHQLQDELRHAKSQAALLDATEMAQLREQFMAVLGHDLRTPLASIALGAEVLSRRELGESTQKVVDRICRSAGRMTRLVDGLLDFTRIRLGDGLPLAPALVGDADAMVRPVIDEVRGAHPEREIVLVVKRGGPVWCDRDRVGQALANLLGNAVEHSPEGTVIELRLDGTDDELWLSVTNAAPPIAPDTLARLFEPFQRGDRTKGSAGLGLGLYIVSEVARAHGGDIEARSTSEGTTFTVKLPRGPLD